MNIEHVGEPGRRCPFRDCRCEGIVSCPPGSPCFVDKAGDLIVMLEHETDDRAALLDVYERIDTNSKSLGRPPSDRSALDEWLSILLEDGTNYVAYHDSRIVGHSAFVPGNTTPPELITFVHPDYQDRGIGTELSRHCIKNATERSDALIMNVGRSNRRATHVGKKLGFSGSGIEQFSTRMQLVFDDDQRSDA